MAHIQSKYLKLWKPQDLTIDKISSQKMFVDNIDFMESFALSVLRRSNAPVESISALRAIDTSDTTLYTDGMTVMVKSSGIYFFDRGNLKDDDGKTIIAPTTGGGRWVSDFSFLNSIVFKESITKDDVGLGNVPNVATNDQTPTYTQSSSLANIASGEKLSVSMGKIMKAIAELISHLQNKNNPHEVTKDKIGLDKVDNTADKDKPVSTAQQSALDGKVPTTRKINGKQLSADITINATDVGAMSPAFASNNTSTNDDDLDNIINSTFNSMTDNSSRVIRVNFSVQHEFFVNGISAVITIYRFSANYGCLTAMTYSPTPDIFVRSKFNGTWGGWVDKSSTIATAIVE